VCRPRAVLDADDVHVCSCCPSQGQFCRCGALAVVGCF
jgi:hypothetical protein